MQSLFFRFLLRLLPFWLLLLDRKISVWKNQLKHIWRYQNFRLPRTVIIQSVNPPNASSIRLNQPQPMKDFRQTAVPRLRNAASDILHRQAWKQAPNRNKFHTGITDINNNTLYNEKLAPDTSLELIKIAEKYNIYYQAFSANSWNISDDSSKWLNYYTSIAEIYDYKIGFNNLKNKEDFHFIKFMFIAENEILKKIEKELNNIFSSNIYHTFSRDVYLEVMNPKVSKANALKFILDKYSISREETIAFGDNNNDLEMLEFAGISVAVDNAEKNIKEKCQYITKSNEENGVGEFLNKYLELGL